MRRIWSIIPRKFRRRSIAVSLTIVIRALLNAVGIAALLPILYIILDAESVRSNPLLGKIYSALGFTSEHNFAIAVAVSVVLFIVAKCLLNLLLYRVERDYIFALYRHLSRNLYIDYFNRGLQFIKQSNSAVLSRNVNIVCYTFVTGVLRPIATIAGEAVLFALLFTAMALYNLTTALLAAAIFAVAAWLYFRIMRRRLDLYGKRENEAQRRKYRDVTESYRGFAEIEINNAFASRLASFDEQMATIISVGRKNATAATLPHIFTEVGLALAMALLVVLCAESGSSDLKMLFGIFAISALRLLPSIRAIMASWTALRYNRYTIDIIGELPKSGHTERDSSTERINFQREIEVRNLSFRFDDAESDTLHNLSLTINRGEKVAITGRSGAGKTTLLNLLLGLYTPSRGEILIDGRRLDASAHRRWQNSIGYVSQSIFLTDSTLLENIALGQRSEHIDRERVMRAVEAASLGEFIAQLPHGLDTRIGECGALLSGGQRQRIGIARAIYKEADILFFDEATSSLDNLTERDINSAIEHLSKQNSQLTIVVVSHRDSSLGYCDRTITL